MNWIELLSTLLMMSLMLYHNKHMLKNTTMMLTMMSMMYMYNNMNKLLMNTWTNFLHLWMLMSWNISTKHTKNQK